MTNLRTSSLKTTNISILPACTPEAAGIPSGAVLRMIERLSRTGFPMHSLLLLRRGKLAAEAYYAPYHREHLHRMFSISKSFTSMAIGLLADEGRIHLDDPIISHFPEYAPVNPHPYLRAMTIRHMLKMQTCYKATTYKLDMSKNWVESFFTTEPDHMPGTIFNYDTSASHTLCALAEKLTGKPMLTYLKEKALYKVGFSEESYMLPDPFGTSMGGSGLMATPLDLAKFALLIQNKGRHNGEQLLPEWYIEEAVSFQTPTLHKGPTLEERQGYGYQFWLTRHGGYVCYGMGGQLVIFLPKQDLICVTTADTQGMDGGNQFIYNTLYEEILPCLSEEPLPEDPETAKRLSDLRGSLRIPPLPGSADSPIASLISGKSYHMEPNPSGFRSVSFTFEPDSKEGAFTYTLPHGAFCLPFILGGQRLSSFPYYNQQCVTSAAWLDEHTLCIKSELTDECMGSVWIEASFLEHSVTLFMKETEESFFKEFSGFFTGLLAE